MWDLSKTDSIRYAATFSDRNGADPPAAGLAGRTGTAGGVLAEGGGGSDGGIRRDRGDLAELLVHRAEQENQRRAHGRDHEEPEHTRGDVVDGRRGRGRRESAHHHRLTLSSTPAN